MVLKCEFAYKIIATFNHPKTYFSNFDNNILAALHDD